MYISGIILAIFTSNKTQVTIQHIAQIEKQPDSIK